MSGFFGSLGIDADDVKAQTGFKEPDDGLYEFEVSKAEIKEGTQKDPNAMGLIVAYLLDNGETKSEYFPMPTDPDDDSQKAIRGLSQFKGRLLDLGFPDDGSVLSEVGPDDLIGITGGFRLVTQKGKNGGEFQNIRNVKVDEAEEEPAPKPKKKATKAKAQPAEEPKKAAKKPVRQESDAANLFADEDDED